MIEIEITQTPDSLSLGTLVFPMDILTIGGHSSSILNIDDEYIFAKHLKLTVNDKNKLFCENIGSAPFFHLNGNKIQGKLQIKISDQIKIGETVIKILKTNPTHQYNFNHDFNERLNAFYQHANKEQLALLEKIEKEIVFMETLKSL